MPKKIHAAAQDVSSVNINLFLFIYSLFFYVLMIENVKFA